MANPSPHFSEEQRLAAADLIRRIQSGEKIPLAELTAFIQSSGKIIQTQIRSTEKAEKPRDVDFF